MRYSIEPKKRRYVKGHGFLSFAKNIGTHAANVVETAKKSATDAIKTASKRAIQKTAEATGDLIGNKIADKITAELSPKDVSKEVTSAPKKSRNLIMKYQKRGIFLQKKGKIFLMS